MNAAIPLQTDLDRRLAEHREEVARLREQLGDPEEALSAFIREHFDRDALEQAVRATFDEMGAWCDDDDDDELGG